MTSIYTHIHVNVAVLIIADCLLSWLKTKYHHNIIIILYSIVCATLKKFNVFSLSLSFCLIYNTVPSAPLNVTVSAINSTSLRVAWQPPATPNGQPTYVVYYKRTEGFAPTNYRTQTLPNSENKTIIPNLAVYTNYSVMVSANTSCDETHSEAMIGRTAEAEPGPPTNLSDVVLPTSVTVRWAEPTDPRGNITHYNVSQKDGVERHSPPCMDRDCIWWWKGCVLVYERSCMWNIHVHSNIASYTGVY